MNKILVTGGTGFIGRHLVRRLIEENYEVHIIGRKGSRFDCFKTYEHKIKTYIYDGTIISMMKIVEHSKPQSVIHLATHFIAEHQLSDVDQLIASNITLGAHLLEAMIYYGVKGFLNVGTIWQNRETEDYDPMNLYAATKESFVNILRWYTLKGNLRAITLKLYDTYGLEDTRRKIFNLLKEHSNSDQLLELSGGEQEMGLVYIDDIVDAFVLCLNELNRSTENTYKEYFLPPEEFVKLKTLVKTYEEAMDITLNVEWGKRSYRFREIMKPFRGESITGWKPKVSLKEGIRKMNQ
ncbi:NAD(P)-dependent oxidoreductase [Fusibacter sp. 3D3]|uniref:NAD-dependent epimerase/dehydratase family protein n=1 Tax=Fusibacter sp. 3D3 TaxID=1048380 RepID=UPI0008539689|nr:NAD-dependent epimerase/dehydratase family protein [Fusibacter sp. 3D3]GAU75648.1 UDP-glucose 4-epimerase [Fusibacter sp. 3D3]